MFTDCRMAQLYSDMDNFNFTYYQHRFDCRVTKTGTSALPREQTRATTGMWTARLEGSAYGTGIEAGPWDTAERMRPQIIAWYERAKLSGEVRPK